MPATAITRLESERTVTLKSLDIGVKADGIGGTMVTVKAIPVNEFTRLRVKARRAAGAFPDSGLAKQIAADVNRSF